MVITPAPDSLISERIGMNALEQALGAEPFAVVAGVLADMDLRFDPVEACEFHWAEMALHAAATNAAFLLHEDGATTEEAEDYLREWAFESNEKAARSVAFMTEPSSPRTCPPMPTAEPLCWNFAERSPRNFTRLLTEQLTSAELLS